MTARFMSFYKPGVTAAPCCNAPDATLCGNSVFARITKKKFWKICRNHGAALGRQRAHAGQAGCGEQAGPDWPGTAAHSETSRGPQLRRGAHAAQQGEQQPTWNAAQGHAQCHSGGVQAHRPFFHFYILKKQNFKNICRIGRFSKMDACRPPNGRHIF